jgi:hypothetical protein
VVTQPEKMKGRRLSRADRFSEHTLISLLALHLLYEEAFRRWDQGEKTLIFCFRVPTARTLARLLAEGINQRLRRSRRALLESRGTEVTAEADIDRAMQQFRRALTAREGSEVPIFLDRVLLGWFQARELPLPALTDADRKQVGTLDARAARSGHPPLVLPGAASLQSSCFVSGPGLCGGATCGRTERRGDGDAVVVVPGPG